MDSAVAAQYIGHREGFSATPYNDPHTDAHGHQVGANIYRAGYGSDTTTLADGTVVPITATTVVTQADAERDLQRRIDSEFVPGVISTVGQQAWDALSPSAQVAVTSMAYNYGGLSHLPTLVHAIQSGDTGAISTAIAARANDNGGVNSSRRTEEASIVSNPTALNSILGLPTPPADVPGSAPTVGAPPAHALTLADFYGQHTRPVPLAPILKNVSGSPDDRDARPNLVSSVGANAPATATPAPAAATSAAAPQTITINGHTYKVGDQLSSGGGTYLVTPNGIEKQGYSPPGAGQPNVYDSVLGHVLGDAMNSGVSKVKQAGSTLIDDLKNAAGGVANWYTGAGSPAPVTATPSPTNPSAPALNINVGSVLSGIGKLFAGGSPSVAANSSGSPDDRDAALLHTVAQGSPTGSVHGPTGSVPTSPLVSMFNVPQSSDAQHAAPYNPQPASSGTSHAAPSVPQTSGPVGQSAAPASHPSVPQTAGPAGGPYSPPSQLASMFDVPQTAGPAGQPAAPTYTTKSVTHQIPTQVINPAYTEWMNNQTPISPFTNPGVQGLSPDDRDSPDGIARAVPGLTSSVFNKPAPPKYITVTQPKTVQVRVPQTAGPVGQPAPAPVVAPKPMTAVDLYRAANPTASPSQAYNAVAAPAAYQAANPNGAVYASITGNSGSGQVRGGALA